MKYTNEKLKKLIETGIPCSEVIFQSAVNNADNIPENGFNEASDVGSRRAEMWLTSAPIMIFKQKECLFWTALSNIRSSKFKPDLNEK